jgi:hypothetical protein
LGLAAAPERGQNPNERERLFALVISFFAERTVVMTRTIWAAQFVLMAAVFCVAQAPSQPIMAPDDVHLSLRTANERDHFRVGEPIPVEASYSANSQQYIYVTNAAKLAGGYPLQIECTPKVESIFQADRAVRAQQSRFQEILVDPTCGAGIGGGIGGGCGDCDGEITLGSSPLRFANWDLNKYVRFSHSGTYSCRATSAQITTAQKEEKYRSALLLQSNLLTVTLTDDPAWAHAEANALGANYRTDCRTIDNFDKRFAHCADIATRLSYLDTLDALAAKIHLLDGINRGWDNGFWESIETTSHLNDAVKLLTGRIQDADVAVSASVLYWLASSATKSEIPDAFQPGAAPSVYYAEATEQLRKYVRLLGSSLAKKNADALSESLQTYKRIAAQPSCSNGPLIPDVERNTVVQAITRSEARQGGVPNR